MGTPSCAGMEQNGIHERVGGAAFPDKHMALPQRQLFCAPAQAARTGVLVVVILALIFSAIFVRMQTISGNTASPANALTARRSKYGCLAHSECAAGEFCSMVFVQLSDVRFPFGRCNSCDECVCDSFAIDDLCPSYCGGGRCEPQLFCMTSVASHLYI